jgi:uncharacterized repeat protein (TIGR03803 family)
MKSIFVFATSLVLLAVMVVAAHAASRPAPTETLVHQFNQVSHGYFLNAVVADAGGSLYGTTIYGGAYNRGTVFELSPRAHGQWKETVLLYSFTGGSDGDAPEGGVTLDAAGNIYGTTYVGGVSGSGVVFRLTQNGSGSWTEYVLHSFGGTTHGAEAFTPVVVDSGGNVFGVTFKGGAGPTGWNGVVFSLNSSAGGKWKPTTIYGFPFSDGAAPYPNLLPDGLGTFYGTSSYGGAYDLGTVFELSPNTNGGWKETIIYSVPSGRLTGVNGVSPSSLIWDSAGNLYGITSYGGYWQYGSVFELSPSAGGGWTEEDLFDFPVIAYPQAVLVFDKAGNLYGTTTEGGTFGKGTIFQLSPAGGTWNFNTIYSFQGYPSDGTYPVATLTMDAAGNFYGTTERGGPSTNCAGAAGRPVGCGTVFELSLVSQQWTEKVLYSFAGSSLDGANPEASLIFDGAGNLYGTTAKGGNGGPCLINKVPSCGIVFELSPAAGGDWSEKISYEFTNANGDGSTPLAGLIFDRSGNLYGTTSAGGTFSQELCRGCGTAFELSPASGGGWTESVLHSFGSGYDGTYPASTLVLDRAGNLYGTTAAGGQAGVGTVFKIKP